MKTDMCHLSHSVLHLQITGVFVVGCPHIFHTIRQKLIAVVLGHELNPRLLALQLDS